MSFGGWKESNGLPAQLSRADQAIVLTCESSHSQVDIRVRVSGGGHTSQIYAIRQAIAKALVAYYAKFYDASSSLELRQLFTSYDRTLLIADPRRMEPKKFGGRGARARRQKVSVHLGGCLSGSARGLTLNRTPPNSLTVKQLQSSPCAELRPSGAQASGSLFCTLIGRGQTRQPACGLPVCSCILENTSHMQITRHMQAALQQSCRLEMESNET